MDPLPHASVPAAGAPSGRYARCGRTLGAGLGFRFPGHSGTVVRLDLRCALRHRPIVRRELATALVVGTLLTAINQDDAIVTATLTPILLWKILLTYVVPFAVAAYSALAISREHRSPNRTAGTGFAA